MDEGNSIVSPLAPTSLARGRAAFGLLSLRSSLLQTRQERPYLLDRLCLIQTGGNKEIVIQCLGHHKYYPFACRDIATYTPYSGIIPVKRYKR